MAEPRDYAENLAIIWAMRKPSEDPRMQEAMRRFGGTIYGGSGVQLAANRSSQYAQATRGMLDDILRGAQVTEPCKEFLLGVVVTNQTLGAPVERTLPLEFLGISLENGQYGIFDPASDRASIEQKLLEFQEVVALSTFTRREQARGLLARWREAYAEKYGVPPKSTGGF